MTNRTNDIWRWGGSRVIGAVVCGALMFSVPGCSKEDDSAAQPPATTHTRIASAPMSSFEPSWTVADLDMAPGVQFPEDRVPESRATAQAIADFASTFVLGADDRLKSMLADRDRSILGSMVSSGEWASQVEATNAVRIVVVEEAGDGLRLGLGFGDPLGAYLTGWEASGSGSEWTFAGLAIAPVIVARLEDLDGATLDPPVLPDAGAKAESTILAANQDKSTDDDEEDEPTPQPSASPGGLVDDPF